MTRASSAPGWWTPPPRCGLEHPAVRRTRAVRSWVAIGPQVRTASFLGRLDDPNVAGRVVRDLVRHAPQQEAPRTGHALVADQDQVGVVLLGDVEDGVGGIPLPRVGYHLDLGLLRHTRRLVEQELHVLARVDRVGDVAGDARFLIPEASLRDRLVGAHDLKLRVGEPGELDSGLHRRGGGLRAIGSYHYAVEHRSSSRRLN